MKAKGQAPEIVLRNGKPVAVIVSADDYARLAASRPAFSLALKAFMEAWPAAGAEIDDSFLRGTRAKSAGRDFSW